MRSHTVSDIDLIIRTGGYERLSGFVPIQSAQAEIIIVKDLWPSLKTTYVRSLIRSFHQRKRNLGK
jgi:undecaprenyl diphosphate synthase